MGNIFSKPKSTKATLRELNSKILEAEKMHKSLIKAKTKNLWKMIFFSFGFSVLCVVYAFLDNQNIPIVLSLGVFLCMVFYWLISFYFSFRVDSYGIYLDELKELQKEQVEKLKAEEDFLETVELVDKFDEDRVRHLHFSRIQQRNKGVFDKVTDVVLGSDPTKLYALICKECHYHNGMIPPGEYEEYGEFVCYNCNTHNER